MDTLTFKISTKYSGKRLDRYLSERFPFKSRNWWQKNISSHQVLLYELCSNGTALLREGTVKPSTRIDENTICAISEAIFAEFRRTFDKDSLDVIYEDRNIVVVNKPPGLVVHPVNTLTRGSLSCLLEERLKKKVFLCHRLDRSTSGVMVIALNYDTASEISRQFRENLVQKTYNAVVEGSPLWDKMTVSSPIGPDPDSQIRLKMKTFREQLSSNSKIKPSLTLLKVLTRYQNYSLIEAKPRTGRTHQIRVHLASIQMPVVHDKLYGRVPDIDYFESGIGNLSPYSNQWHGLHGKTIELNVPGLGNRLFHAYSLLSQEIVSFIASQRSCENETKAPTTEG